jgi:hypothetical protein
MVSQEEQTAIDTLLFESESVTSIASAVPGMRAEELNYLIRHYNWDDGFSVPQSVSQHPQCDLATALEMFWLSEAVSVIDLEEPPSPLRREWFEFARLLTSRISSGHYPRGRNRFLPGLSRVEEYRFRKQGVPDVFLAPVEPITD